MDEPDRRRLRACIARYRIEVPSSWDSNIVPLFLVEALIAAIANLHWPETQQRIKELEAIVEAQRRTRR